MFIMKAIALLLLSLTAVSAVPNEYASIHRELRRRKDHTCEPQYYTLRRDSRECLSPSHPRCGGYFVQALNQKSTKCYNRKKSREGCYVAALDLSNTTGLDPSGFSERIMSSDGGVVLGRYKPAAYPDLADLVVEAGWVSFEEVTRSVAPYCDCDPNDAGPVCDCGPDEVCIDNPSDRCLGCTCPTICRSNSPIDCSSGGAECPPNLFCIVENPFNCSDDCKSTCVAFDQRNSTCGGSKGWKCLRGQTCIYRDCDPAIAGADCAGVCVQKVGAFCGGSFGIRCGRGLTCVDPLEDGCDNQCNEADCGGICLPDLVLQLGGE
jgi:hypothetical protein